jgi:hypothetical protein
VHKITQDQLVTRKGGWTTFIAADGHKVKDRNTNVEVVDADESARTPKPRAEKPAKPPKAAKPAAEADGEEDEDGDEPKKRRVGSTFHDCRHYEKTKTANGNTSLDSGDALAVELRAADLEDVYRKAATMLGLTIKELKAAYEKLNPGMQRMNLGNRMRAYQRKAAKAA